MPILEATTNLSSTRRAIGSRSFRALSSCRVTSPRILNNDFRVCGMCRQCGIAPDGTRLNNDEGVSASTSGLVEGTAPEAPTKNDAIPIGTPNGSAYVFYSYSEFKRIFTRFVEQYTSYTGRCDTRNET
jgi:hypothetical protein